MAIRLVYFNRQGRPKKIILEDGVTVIGRKSECNIRVPLPFVSRKHCRIVWDKDKTVVQDLGSANGTFLNNERVVEADLTPGDLLVVGPMTFIIQIDGEPRQIEPPPPPPAQFRLPTEPSSQEDLLASDSFPGF